MSQYTPVANFTNKDSLVTGNPLKAVKGTELGTEFAAVQVAVNSKFDGSVVFAPDGTVVQPSFGFTNNAGTGMYNTAGVVSFATNQIQRMSIALAGGVTVSAPTSGVAFNTSAAASASAAVFTAGTNAVNTFAVRIQGDSTASKSSGLQISAGTNTSDNALIVRDTTAATNFLIVAGDGSATFGTPTGGAQGVGTINAGGLFINGNPVYNGIPINVQSVNYVLVLADANKCVSQSNAAGTVTIPTNASVAFPVGTACSIYNNTAGNITIPTNGDTVRFGSSGVSGTRTLAQNGTATILKIAATTWTITGTGLT